MQIADSWGLETTAPEPEAVERFDALVDGFVTFAADLPGVLRAAVAGPSAPMAEIAFGYMLLQSHTAADHLGASAAAGRAAESELNEREQLHLEALRLWLAGQVDETNARWDTILDRWPTDMLALRLQHFRLFGRGELDGMLHSARRSIDAWDELPRRSYLDGMKAFALEELGDYGRAERLGRAASEADSGDLWSVHAVAHVLEMQGRAEDALTLFEGRSDELHARGSFSRHLWWHHAITYLHTKEYDKLLALYDAEVQPGPAVDGLSLTNAIDGLARLEFAGVDVGERWHALRDGASFRLGYHDQPFNDAHFAYALARAGDEESVAQLLEGMASWSDRAGTSAEVTREVGLDTASGMAALGFGRKAEAAELLSRGENDWWMLGGSHAQRQVFALALAAAE